MQTPVTGDITMSDGIDAILSTSASSGYCSGYSSDSSSTYCNISDKDFFFNDKFSENIENNFIPAADNVHPFCIDSTSCDTVINAPRYNTLGSCSDDSDSVMAKSFECPLSDHPSSTDKTSAKNIKHITTCQTRESNPEGFKFTSQKSQKSILLSHFTSNGVPRRRLKDNEGYIRRAACVCLNEDETKVVLISSKNGGGWLIPGGGVEWGEGESEAAVREAWEEAGVTGIVKRCLGIFQVEDLVTLKKKRTAVYVMAVQKQHSEFPEAELGRVREWFPIDLALCHLSQSRPHQMPYLQAL